MIKNFCSRASLIALEAGALALPASPALAQSAAADEASASSGSGSDIIVTAQRRSERLVDVPMAVVAVSSETIEKTGVVSIQDINKLAPGVSFNFAGCCSQPSVRGISNLTTGIGYENNVAIYVDGFYTPDNISINGDLASLESIEILKGPQGALWGRNATGGAILMNTRKPTDYFTGKAEAGYASYNELTLSGYVSGPLADFARFSIAAYNRTSDGFYDHYSPQGTDFVKDSDKAAKIRQTAVRAKLELDLGERTTATVGANYGKSSDPRGVIFTYFEYTPSYITRGKPYATYNNFPNVAEAELKEGTLKLVHDADWGTITSYTGFAHRDTHMGYDYDGGPATIFHTESNWDQDTFQQAVDVNVTSVDGVNLVIGGSYYHDKLGSKNQDGFGGTGWFSHTESTLTTESLAAYADASINLTDQLVLDLSGRYTHETKKIDILKTNGAGGVVTFPETRKSVSFDNFSPRGSLRYEIGPRTNVYASISTGFRPGGWNPNGSPSSDPADLQPHKSEKITAYELGFKTASSALSFETAVFYYNFKNLQIGQTQQIDGNLFNIVYNSPKAEIYGIDGLISYEPVENLNLRLGAAYLHARYKELYLIYGLGLDAATGLNINSQAQNWDNQEMARSPEFSGTFSADYTIEDVVGGGLTFGGNVFYTSSFVPNSPSLYGPLGPAGLEDTQRFRQSAYALVNAQVSWSDEGDRYKLTLYVNNLTDKTYKLSYNGGSFGDYAAFGSPRTFGGKVSVNF